MKNNNSYNFHESDVDLDKINELCNKYSKDELAKMSDELLEKARKELSK